MKKRELKTLWNRIWFQWLLCREQCTHKKEGDKNAAVAFGVLELMWINQDQDLLRIESASHLDSCTFLPFRLSFFVRFVAAKASIPPFSPFDSFLTLLRFLLID